MSNLSPHQCHNDYQQQHTGITGMYPMLDNSCSASILPPNRSLTILAYSSLYSSADYIIFTASSD